MAQSLTSNESHEDENMYMGSLISQATYLSKFFCKHLKLIISAMTVRSDHICRKERIMFGLWSVTAFEIR